MARHFLQITDNKQLNEEYFFLTVENPYGDLIPGQFFEVMPPNAEHLRVPVSIYDAKEVLRFMFKKVGKKTRALSQLERGDYLDVIGPLGNGFTVMEQGKALLVSGGIGYAPLFFLKEKLEKKGISTIFLHGGRTFSDVGFGAEDQIYTDDGSAGNKGFVTEGLLNLTAENEFSRAYICGPEIMMRKCVELLRGKIKMQVSLEAYMACGVGVCKGCVKKINGTYKTVCKDGPVFDGEEVDFAE